MSGVVGATDHYTVQSGDTELPPPGEIRLQGLTKHFGDDVAVKSLDLVIKAGEFFSILGSSGCGKTTTLRMIAGFERPTAGYVFVDGIDLSQVPAHKRPVNTVFQSYALFPHLTVFDNIAFGLHRQRVVRSEVDRRVSDIVETVHLQGFERRKPQELSGGQQQRVALARALVLRPSVLLLDEPLGALDAKLRRSLQVELKILQQQVGTTFVYVTHDQEEALAMSDRIAIMRDGELLQVEKPEKMYEAPIDAYVADFFGKSNILPAQILKVRDNGLVEVDVFGQRELARADHQIRPGPCQVSIRPERLDIEITEDKSFGGIRATVAQCVYLGANVEYECLLHDGTVVRVLRPYHLQGTLPPGTQVKVVIREYGVRILKQT